MTNKKICVYAICKNEEKHIYRWLESVSEADYVVVLDTGSTDNSFTMLKNDNRVTKVKQKTIKPWRFDVARNESMKLIPDDAEILVCIDIDEVIEAGWAKVLREGWEDGDSRCYYKYAWSHNDLGEPQDLFTYDKIHTKDFHWIYPVHEVLAPNDPDKEITAFDAEDHIFVHHLPDNSKSRSFYFDLLKLSVEENPDDSHCRMLLAREYLLNKDYDNALKEYHACLTYQDIRTPEKILVLEETNSRIGDIYFAAGDYYEAIKYYLECIAYDNTHLDPYICLGELYNTIGQYAIAKGIVESALEICVRHYDWTERKETWTAAADDVLAVSYYHLGKYDIALSHAKIAADHNPNNLRIIKNLNNIMLAKYEGITNKEVISN